MSLLGLWLRQLRKSRGFTQTQVSDLLGRRGVNLPDSTLSQWEVSGTVPNAVQLDALASLYGVSLGDLLLPLSAPEQARRELDAARRKEFRDEGASI